MKIFKIIISASLLCLLSLISCNRSDDQFVEKTTPLEFKVFKNNFPHLSSMFNVDYIQTADLDLGTYKSSQTTIKGVTFPIIEDNKVIGRYIGISDESKGVYLDYSDYTNKIVAYDANNPSFNKTFRMVYNQDNQNYEPVLNGTKSYWCEITCCLGALAISAGDGPAPVMDIIALAFFTSCMIDCND